MGACARDWSRVAARTICSGVPVGVLATATMDAAMVAAAVAGGPAWDSPRLSPGLIGRWVASLATGHWRARDESERPPSAAETALGIATHYATGTGLTISFLGLVPGRRRDLRAATAYGLASAVLPLFVMFPSMGYGWCGHRTGEAARINRIMLLGHLAFGIGIGAWCRLWTTSAAALGGLPAGGLDRPDARA